MRFETSQHMQLSQQMKLSPRMIQSMEILQMPMLALQERIEQELESNIALEQLEPGTEAGGEERSSSDQIHENREEAHREDNIEAGELIIGEDSTGHIEDFERLSAYESSYRAASENEYSSQKFTNRLSGERDGKMDAMANLAGRNETLTEQLLHQWSFAEVEETIADIGRRLIGYIDNAGLLNSNLKTILEQNRNIPGVEITIELLERALRELQFWLDPPGLAARDVQEVLLLQLDDLALHDKDESHDWETVRLLIRNHLDDLLQNRLPKIAREAGRSVESIQQALVLMRLLNPSPGHDLVTEDVPPVIPDVVVEYNEQNDEYLAAMRGGLLPTLQLSNKYETMAKDRTVEKETRDFVKNNLVNATWLIESIHQRNNTVLRVVKVVLTRQRGFFDHGPQHLKPLPMTEVAEQLGIDVSTVSRAVADKWMQTPRGVFPLRRFFSGGRESDSGKDMSWEAVKEILREIVDAENKAKPFSDEALSQELKTRGIDIARRTVVKYRQQLDIPPARRRKVF